MSYYALASGLSQHAASLRDQMAKTRIGVVKTYDPRYHTATVLIKPEGILTGSLPVLSPFVGNGWGLVMAPSPGDQVEVQFQENDLEAGLVVLRFFPILPGRRWMLQGISVPRAMSGWCTKPVRCLNSIATVRLS